MPKTESVFRQISQYFFVFFVFSHALFIILNWLYYPYLFIFLIFKNKYSTTQHTHSTQHTQYTSTHTAYNTNNTQQITLHHITPHHILHLFSGHFGGHGVCFGPSRRGRRRFGWDVSRQHNFGERRTCCLVGQIVFCGGNSTKATSGINGANTRTQREKGIKDSADLFTSDTLKGVAKKPELAKVLCENSGADVEWLMDRFYLDLPLVARLGGHSAPRTHRHFDIYGQIVRYTWVWRRVTQRTIR